MKTQTNSKKSNRSRRNRRHDTGFRIGNHDDALNKLGGKPKKYDDAPRRRHSDGGMTWERLSEGVYAHSAVFWGVVVHGVLHVAAAAVRPSKGKMRLFWQNRDGSQSHTRVWKEKLPRQGGMPAMAEFGSAFPKGRRGQMTVTCLPDGTVKATSSFIDGPALRTVPVVFATETARRADAWMQANGMPGIAPSCELRDKAYRTLPFGLFQATFGKLGFAGAVKVLGEAGVPIHVATTNEELAAAPPSTETRGKRRRPARRAPEPEAGQEPVPAGADTVADEPW